MRDIDEVHRTALAMGAEVVWTLQDESFGQRHFMVADPTGLVVDVITDNSTASTDSFETMKRPPESIRRCSRQRRSTG